MQTLDSNFSRHKSLLVVLENPHVRMLLALLRSVALRLGPWRHQLSFNKLFLCKSPKGHKVVGRTQRKGQENKDAQEGSVGWGEKGDEIFYRHVRLRPSLDSPRHGQDSNNFTKLDMQLYRS